MKNIKSEILFNRSLLWLIIADVALLRNANKWFIVAYLTAATYNMYKSFDTWGKE